MIVEHGKENGYPQTTVFKYDVDGNRVPVLTVYDEVQSFWRNRQHVSQ